jgi:PAS domain S-box-containing protein
MMSPGQTPSVERRNSERTVGRASEDLVGAIVRLMPDAAVVVDDGGRIVAANPLAEAMFGYEPGRLAGEGVDQLVPERFRNGHAGHRSNYVAQPAQRPMGAGLELRAKRRDGSEFHVDIHLAPLGVREKPLTLAAVRDLTERRAEWVALGELAAIVAATDDAIVSMDLAGTVTGWNPGAHRLLGYRAEEMRGRSIFELVNQDRRSEMEVKLTRVRAGRHIPTVDTRRARKNGEQIDVAESMSLIREPSGEPLGIAAVMSDITERKLAELELRRLLTETQKRQRWLEAISDIRLNLMSKGKLDEGLELIAKRVCELADTDSSAILLTGHAPGSMAVAASEGEAFPKPSPQELKATEPFLGHVLEHSRTWVTPDLGQEIAQTKNGRLAGPGQRGQGPEKGTEFETSDSLFGTPERRSTVGAAIVSPLATSQGVAGLLFVSRVPGRSPFEREDVTMVESLARQAGLVVEVAQAAEDREQLALMADRERIARDLHDHVIQRLFAVGMALQTAANSIENSKALERISDSVEELDATIRDVRSTIFSLELRATERVERSARSQVLDVASKSSDALGFQPRLRFEGPVDTRVPADLVPDMLAVVRESLSNSARHAAARSVELEVSVGEDLVVTVADDGRGMLGVTRFSGLANLNERAVTRGGSMSITPNGSVGTRIEWRVPLG